MATINTGIRLDSNFLNLKNMDEKDMRQEVKNMMVDGEKILSCFKTIRDQVIFTNKRILVVNVQGLTGKKISYFSYPYSKVQYFGIETAGLIDIDSELVIAFSNGNNLRFDFRTSVNIEEICSSISKYIL